MRFRVILLIGWILGILLPVYWFSRFSPSYGAVFDRVFGTEISHILAHIFLYAGLAYLLTSIFLRPGWPVKRIFFSVLAVVALVAVFQEGIQAIFARVPFAPDDILDLFVDLSGGLLGAALGVKFRSTRSG